MVCLNIQTQSHYFSVCVPCVGSGVPASQACEPARAGTLRSGAGITWCNLPAVEVRAIWQSICTHKITTRTPDTSGNLGNNRSESSDFYFFHWVGGKCQPKSGPPLPACAELTLSSGSTRLMARARRSLLWPVSLSLQVSCRALSCSSSMQRKSWAAQERECATLTFSCTSCGELSSTDTHATNHPCSHCTCICR